MLNGYFVWSTGTRLERRLAALRQAGEPVQIADLAREPIPPEKNADVFLRRAADDLDAIQKELLVVYPKVGYPTGTVLPADQEGMEKMFAAYPKVMPLLEQAADCPDSDPQLDFTLPPSRSSDLWIAATNIASLSRLAGSIRHASRRKAAPTMPSPPRSWRCV